MMSDTNRASKKIKRDAKAAHIYNHISSSCVEIQLRLFHLNNKRHCCTFMKSDMLNAASFVYPDSSRT